MPAEPSREAINAVLRAARAFAEMHDALDKAQAARDGAVPDQVLRDVAAGDLEAVQDALRG